MERVVFAIGLLLAICGCGNVSAQSDEFDAKMKEYGLIDVQTLDKEIGVELKYATEDNFVGENMYGSLTTAYLLPHFAQKVVQAQQILRQRRAEHSLLIYDAARPISVQRRMRKAVEGTPLQIYVADGQRGGRHNYGVAVDLTIVDSEGRPLDMGAGFDHFGREAWVGEDSDVEIARYKAYVDGLVSEGLISREAGENRKLLLEIMDAVGLRPYVKEWWHFQERISMTATRQKYKLLDF